MKIVSYLPIPNIEQSKMTDDGISQPRLLIRLNPNDEFRLCNAVHIANFWRGIIHTNVAPIKFDRNTIKIHNVINICVNDEESIQFEISIDPVMNKTRFSSNFILQIINTGIKRMIDKPDNNAIKQGIYSSQIIQAKQ